MSANRQINQINNECFTDISKVNKSIKISSFRKVFSKYCDTEPFLQKKSFIPGCGGNNATTN